jgi:hypothetical protein
VLSGHPGFGIPCHRWVGLPPRRPGPGGSGPCREVRPHPRQHLYIEALFGARPPAASLLRQTNQLLASLTVT